MKQIPYHHVKKHFRKHKKHYVRFIAFFIFLLVFTLLEDTIVAFATGATVEIYTLLIILGVALFFTAIADYTEKAFEKETEKVIRVVEKEEKAIKRRI